MDNEGNTQKAIEPGRSPNPVGDNTEKHDRLDEHEKKVDRVRIVPFIVVRQPSAAPEQSQNPYRDRHVNERVDNRFGFQIGE